MSNLHDKFQQVIDNLDKHIKDPKELDYVKTQIYGLTMLFLDEIEAITETNVQRMNAINERLTHIEHHGRTKHTHNPNIHTTDCRAKQGNVIDDDEDMKQLMENAEEVSLLQIFRDHQLDITCPYCHHRVTVDYEIRGNEPVICPECNHRVQLVWNGIDEVFLDEMNKLSDDEIIELLETDEMYDDEDEDEDDDDDFDIDEVLAEFEDDDDDYYADKEYYESMDIDVDAMLDRILGPNRRGRANRNDDYDEDDDDYDDEFDDEDDDYADEYISEDIDQDDVEHGMIIKLEADEVKKGKTKGQGKKDNKKGSKSSSGSRSSKGNNSSKGTKGSRGSKGKKTNKDKKPEDGHDSDDDM